MNDITALNGLSNSIREWNTFSKRAICAIEYTHDQKSRDKRSAKIKDKNSDDGKKIMGLIENFSEMKGACNNWAGMYWNIITSTKIKMI